MPLVGLYWVRVETLFDNRNPITLHYQVVSGRQYHQVIIKVSIGLDKPVVHRHYLLNHISLQTRNSEKRLFDRARKDHGQLNR